MQYNFKLAGKKYSAEVEEGEGDKLTITLNGKKYDVEIEKPQAAAPVVRPVAAPTPQRTAAPVATAPRPSAGGKSINSPLPGVVLDIKVNVGDTVQVGQVVMVVEAMKMENNIEATQAGTVTKILKQKGDPVMEGDALIQL